MKPEIGLSAAQRREGRREGLLPAPSRQRVGRGAAGVLLQFMDANGQIAQAGQHFRRTPMPDPAVIFPERDVATIIVEFWGRVWMFDSAENRSAYFFGAWTVAGAAASRLRRKSVRSRSCHWTSSPAVKSSAAASGSGMFTSLSAFSVTE